MPAHNKFMLSPLRGWDVLRYASSAPNKGVKHPQGNLVQYFLIIGAAINFVGAIKLGIESLYMSHEVEADHIQLKLFVIGVASIFGIMYVYLFFHSQYVYPFLFFGTGLKAWAFISCFYLLIKRRIGYKLFCEFGLTNGVVAGMFAALLAGHA